MPNAQCPMPTSFQQICSSLRRDLWFCRTQTIFTPLRHTPMQATASDPAIIPLPINPNDVEVTIVMPCLNEALTVGTCIAKALAALKKSNINGEVVIGDNGSTDGSQ